MEYTWKINSLKVKDEGPNTNAVVQTYWEKTGTDTNGNIGTFSGATPFTSVDVPEGEFIPLAQLTEEIVLGWIQGAINADYEAHINAEIQKQIDAIIDPIQEVDLPWSTEE